MEKEEFNPFGGRPYWVCSYSPIGSGTPFDMTETFTPIVVINGETASMTFNISSFDYRKDCPLCGGKIDDSLPLCEDCMKYYNGDKND